MRKIIILKKEDLFYDKRNAPDFDGENINIFDFNIKREDINEAEFIIYVFKDNKNPNVIKSNIIKARYGEDRYKDLVSSILEYEMEFY